MQATVLTNIRIWDGVGLLDADTIRLEGERIAAIGARSDLAGDAEVIDCQGATAIPGLIDAHVHLELNPDHHKPPEKTDLGQRPLMVERAAAMVQAGITTARDLGGGAWLELELRDRIASAEIPGPRLLCAGQPITCPAGHCHFWGGEAADAVEVKAVLARQVAKGVDLIKVMATGGRMTRGSDPMKPQFDLATLSDITATARAHNLTVAAHCHGTEGIELAARAGVRTIEHCSWAGSEGWGTDFQADVAQLILDRDVWVSPTVNRGWQRMLDSKTGDALTRMRSAYRHLLDLGVPFVASTDAGIPGVFHHHLPLALKVFGAIAEMSAEQTLRTATSAAAAALGVDQITGRLKPTLDADIVLVAGNPLEDLAALAEPVGVWARGRMALDPRAH
ncbi:MAG: amidohydrolase family protein [Gammaproteobacteria bacterium]|nr:amidohydrolase family protein [Gammaproteobacteria bacterium]